MLLLCSKMSPHFTKETFCQFITGIGISKEPRGNIIFPLMQPLFILLFVVPPTYSSYSRVYLLRLLPRGR